MEVTSENFDALLPLVQSTIDDAVLIAIDTEFTGLEPQQYGHRKPDTLAELLDNAIRSVHEFIVIQFGLACVVLDVTNSKYICKAFNFYIFPRDFDGGPDERFLMQASSINFLARNGMDFNKVFGRGISYLDHTGSSDAKNKVSIPIGPNKEWLDSITTQVSAFLSTDAPFLSLPPCNSFLRRLLYQELPLQFPGQVVCQTSKDNKNALNVHRITAEVDKTSLDLLKSAAFSESVNKAVGFRKVIDYITASQKTVVLHNGLLDAAHICTHFAGSIPQPLWWRKGTARNDHHQEQARRPDVSDGGNKTIFRSLIKS